MRNLGEFLYEFLGHFFSGIGTMFAGLWSGLVKIFDINAYREILELYKNEFSFPEWILVCIAIGLLLLSIGLIVALIIIVIRKYIKFNKKAINQEELLDEVANLNNQVNKLMKEKEDILAMKVSQLGLKPGESPTEGGLEDGLIDASESRFAKLTMIDEEYKNYKIKNYNNSFTLQELCENFRNFAGSQLHLYYKPQMMRLFISALASTKLVVLQGISGTGKTSLAYAWGKFTKHNSCVASVQPSWKDRTDLFGYFNEFTKKFNETEILKEMYIADHTDDIYTLILDEMNLSRVEYYFADMLSILEMPNKAEWVIEIVPNSWKTDPKQIVNGKLQVPPNMWYIGTINNDDSTYAVTDKVYDRAMPIDINDKGQAFDAISTPAMDINYTYLDNLFNQAMIDYKISQEMLDKIEQMDNYVIKHFRIAFGNRIVSHMKKFVPVYVGCGGTEIEGIDYFVAKKIFRKFEQLNIAYIKDEIDPFIEFLNKTFGKDQMKECIDYITRLKKLT